MTIPQNLILSAKYTVCSTKYSKARPYFFLVLFFIPLVSFGQSIFSEEDFSYKKSFLPYDVANTFSLGNKEFIMLAEVKKNNMKLGRYDQYFFEKWEKTIEFNKYESTPQAFVKDDKFVTFCITTIEEKKQIRVTFRYFSLNDGTESPATNYVFGMEKKTGFSPKLSFSEDRSKFVIYNYLVNHDNDKSIAFQIFEIGNETPINQYYLQPELLANPKSHAIHLSNDGDLLLAVTEASNFKTETYFWSANTQEMSKVNNNFFFERPVDNIGNIEIIRQSASSYFISFAALIDEELIGFNVTGVNVILKSVMFSYNQNFRNNEIQSLYENYYVTTLNQKKKYLKTPEILDKFRLVKSIVNTKNDVILLFENLEKTTDFHKNSVSENLPWEHTQNEDKFYFGGDILLYCFTESGELKWKKNIQKTQFSQANTLGLSFIPKLNEDTLKLLIHENSKGGNFYIMDINTIDGSLIKTTNLLPDKKYEFTKKYSCWLSDNVVVICGIAPANIKKRTLMLVEF